METIKYLQSTGCGDWHRGWGFGGDDTLGKLYRTEDKEYPYKWVGMRQGRHNQTIHSKYTVIFNYDIVKGFTMHPDNKYNRLPDVRDIQNAIDILTTPIRPRMQRIIKSINPNTQLSLSL